jgi:hypothetical protein
VKTGDLLTRLPGFAFAPRRCRRSETLWIVAALNPLGDGEAMRCLVASSMALLLAACGYPRASGSATDSGSPAPLASPSVFPSATPSPSFPTPSPNPAAYFACANAGACPPGAGIGATFDPVRNALITFGGVDYPNNHLLIRDSTWTFKGGAWTQLHPAHVPAARDTAPLVFDAARNVVVMYGGRDVPDNAAAGRAGEGGITFAADTWTWDGSDWTQQYPAHHPVLFVPEMTYDYARNQILLLGFGQNGMETWTYDGSDWTQHPASKPDPPRVQGWLSFDPASKTVVTFGGHNDGGADVSAVWQWDGQTWRRTAAAMPPVYQLGSIMAPDVNLGSMLLYDSDTGGAPSSTWRWDGRAFQRLQPSHQPQVLALGLSADLSRHRLLLFGWTWPDRQFQVWSWSGADWSQLLV